MRFNMEIALDEINLEELTSEEEAELLTGIKRNLNRDLNKGYRLRLPTSEQFNPSIISEGENIDMTYNEASRLCTLLKWGRYYYSKRADTDENPKSFLEPLRDYFHVKSISQPNGKLNDMEQEIIVSIVKSAHSI